MEENLNNKNTPGSHINFLFTSLHINTKTCELIYNKRLHRICYLSPINNWEPVLVFPVEHYISQIQPPSKQAVIVYDSIFYLM
jgi:hypothetical protein